MNNYDKEFLSEFNEFYPFERYILKNPKSIENLFDDLLLTEIFVPKTEINPILDHNGRLITFTKMNTDDIYVKVKGYAGEMRLGYFDFSATIRGNIRDIVIEDMGEYEYESLYVDHEDGNLELIEMLKTQKSMITDKYKECKVKKSVRDNLI
jgi:hypothetical protein